MRAGQSIVQIATVIKLFVNLVGHSCAQNACLFMNPLVSVSTAEPVLRSFMIIVGSLDVAYVLGIHLFGMMIELLLQYKRTTNVVRLDFSCIAFVCLKDYFWNTNKIQLNNRPDRRIPCNSQGLQSIMLS